MVRRLEIATFLYYALDAVGDDRSARFAGEYRHATTANLVRLTHGTRVRDVLEARGLAPVLLKGGAFLVRFCQEAIGLRPMADLDLLVARDAYADAQGVLREEGLQPDGDPARLSHRVSHARSFVSTRGAVPLDIDLHRGVAQWPVGTDLGLRILERHDRIDSWRIPRVPDAFSLTALHRARHGFAWSPRDLFEIKRTAQAFTDSDWDAVVDGAVASRITGAVWAVYRQAIWWLGSDPIDEERVAQLGARLGAARRRLLERMASPEAVLTLDPRWQRPLLREFVVGPCAITTPGRALAASAMLLPLRVREEWTYARQQGLSATGRLLWLWDYTWGGARAARDTAGRRR